jgi:S-adenosylmethionine:tRNA ribosyltransferase-isomerase
VNASSPSGSLTIGTRTADYDFILPADRIAQVPADRRDQSRLMVVNRASGSIEHRRFAHIVELVAPGDAIAVNTTRVLRARLLGTRDSGGKAEVFLLKSLGEDRFEALVHPGGKLKPGRVVHVAPELDVDILEVTDRRSRVVRLRTPLPVTEAIERFGHVPLPPYISRGDSAADAERYQTVYARETGSVAAPTAGLHFTPGLLERLEANAVTRVDLLLHVGAGTFKPVETDDPANHVMHEEWYRLDERAAIALNETRARARSIWAVGTTSVRTLESVVSRDGSFAPQSGDTRIFIRPPYEFRAVDKLITNFHLPRSTLIMLVAAFAGYDLTMRAYRTALEEGYRFYSYGDAMAVV